MQKMAETKYGKYIITGAKSDLNPHSYRRDAAEIAAGDHTRLYIWMTRS
jgi:hypothetical protein